MNYSLTPARIFVTVGAQMPFDRLIHAVDAWAAAHPQSTVEAQIGVTGLRPRHLKSRAHFDPIELRQAMASADLIIAHAGMGTILSALEIGRPLIVVPRRAALRETRTDHQVATARAFAQSHHIAVAMEIEELPGLLARGATIKAAPRVPNRASDELIGALRSFIHGHVDSAGASQDAESSAVRSHEAPRQRRAA